MSFWVETWIETSLGALVDFLWFYESHNTFSFSTDSKLTESQWYLINHVSNILYEGPTTNPRAPKCQPVATMQKQSCVLQQQLSHRFRKAVLVVSQLKLSVKHLLLRRQMQRSIPWYHSFTDEAGYFHSWYKHRKNLLCVHNSILVINGFRWEF